MYNARVFNIMFAAPSDIQEEIQIGYDVLRHWNSLHSEWKKIILLPLHCLHWSISCYPMMDKQRKKTINEQVVEKSFKKMARALMSFMNLHLRTEDRFFSNTRLALRMFSYSNYVHKKMLFILVYLRICKSSVYIRMCQHDYTLQEFVNEIEALFPKEMLRYDFETHSFYYVLALLILCYNL